MLRNLLVATSAATVLADPSMHLSTRSQSSFEEVDHTPTEHKEEETSTNVANATEVTDAVVSPLGAAYQSMSVNAHGDVTQEADSQSGHVRGAEAENSTTVNIITNSSDENAEPVSIELSNDHGTTTVTVGNSRTSENEPKLVPTTAHNDAPTKTDLHSSTAKAHAKQTGTNKHDRPASMLATKTKHGKVHPSLHEDDEHDYQLHQTQHTHRQHASHQKKKTTESADNGTKTIILFVCVILGISGVIIGVWWFMQNKKKNKNKNRGGNSQGADGTLVAKTDSDATYSEPEARVNSSTSPAAAAAGRRRPQANSDSTGTHAPRPGTQIGSGGVLQGSVVASPGSSDVRANLDTSQVVNVMLKGDKDLFRSQFRESLAHMVAFNEDEGDVSPNDADMLENEAIGGSILMRPGVKPVVRFAGFVSRADNLTVPEGTSVFVLIAIVGQGRDPKEMFRTPAAVTKAADHGGIVAEFDSNWHGELSGDEFESDLMAMVCGDITMELVDASSMAVLGLCTLSIRQILHIAPSNVNTVKSREPLDNPDAHTLANSVLDGKVDCSLNAFHDFKKKKFSKDEQTISRSEMQRALKQLGVQDVESGEAYMWEVLNPHRGGSHVLKKDFDDWIKFARSEKQVLQEEMKTSSVQSLWAALTNETLSVDECNQVLNHVRSINGGQEKVTREKFNAWFWAAAKMTGVSVLLRSIDRSATLEWLHSLGLVASETDVARVWLRLYQLGRVSAFQLSPSSDILAMYENVRHRLFASVKSGEDMTGTLKIEVGAAKSKGVWYVPMG